MTTVKAGPAINTVASAPTGGVVGSVALTDTAVLSGGYNPTGSITFVLKAPDGTTAATETASVSQWERLVLHAYRRHSLPGRHLRLDRHLQR